MILIKPGVVFTKLRPEIYNTFPVIDKEFEAIGKIAVITSAEEGKHKRDSLHYEGLAIDLRTFHLKSPQQSAMVKSLQKKLGPDYDVVWEKDHIHVEFDPEG